MRASSLIHALKITILAIIIASPINVIGRDSASDCREAAGHWEDGIYINHFDEIDADPAIDSCLVAITEDPKNSESHAHLCRAYYKADLELLALETCLTAIELGSLQAYISLESLYRQRNPESELYEIMSFDMLNLAAMSGSAWALYNLAHAYEIGQGTDVDPDMALRLFKAAAENGFFNAAFRVGDILSEREETDQAKAWYASGLKHYQQHFGSYDQFFLRKLITYFEWNKKYFGLSVARQMQSWIEQTAGEPDSEDKAHSISFMLLEIAKITPAEPEADNVEAWVNVLESERNNPASYTIVQQARDQLIERYMETEDYKTALDYVDQSLHQAVLAGVQSNIIASHCYQKIHLTHILEYPSTFDCLYLN